MPHRTALRSPATLLAAAAGALGLAGCGGATPAAQAPVEVAVVAVGAKPTPEEPPNEASKVLEAHRAAEAAGADEEPEEYGIIGLLNSGAGSSGIFGGVPGGVPGGVVGGMVSGGTGFGGIGLGGIGAGGGGTGFGVIGTSGSYGSRYGTGNPVDGQAVHEQGNTVIALGDSVTLGVSLEAATRMMRGRVSAMRTCYQKAQERDRGIEGTVALRLVVGKEGRVVLARDLGSTLPDPAAIACVLDVMKDVYVATVGGTFFGVVETSVHFSPKK